MGAHGPGGRPARSRRRLTDLLYAQVIVEVAPPHLDRPFDYLIPEELAGSVRAGSRVEVVFSGRRVRGLVVGLSDHTEVPPARLRPVRRTLGEHAWVTDDELAILRWAAERYAAPLADVVRHALPTRAVAVERRAHEQGWFDATDRAAAAVAVADDQRGGWERYADADDILAAAAGGSGAWFWRPLPGEEVERLVVELAARTLAGGRDVLVVVGEPASPVADAVAAAFGALAVDVRGDLGIAAVYGRWLRARCGRARVVVGERRVALWPVERLGLAVVVDEANPALKERRSPRHHAREVVLERARRAGATALLTGLVPSAASWRLLAERRLRPLTAPRRDERAAAPVVHVDERDDVRDRGRVGTRALSALRNATASGTYGIVLAARGGEGRALVCTRCGERLGCPVCASSLSPTASGVTCEGCGWETTDRPTCRRCEGVAFAPLAAGAERLGAELSRTLRNPVAVLEGYARPFPPAPAVVVLTRGSVGWRAPGQVGAVVLADIDGLLRRPTLDAAEDTLRLALTLASWVVPSARAGGPAEVVVQTRDPLHHAIRALVGWDGGGFWRTEAGRRAELRFPPVASAIRLETDAATAERVRAEVVAQLPPDDDVLGPIVEGSRARLLVKASHRVRTVGALRTLRTAWSAEGIDVRVDVDPVDAL